MKRLPIVFCAILGSFVIYCGQSIYTAVDSWLGDGGPGGDGHSGADGRRGNGFLRDAHAAEATCCAPAPYSFKKIGEGTLSNAAKESQPFAVGAYREVVVYMVSNSAGCSGPYVKFRSDGSSSYGTIGGTSLNDGGRIRVDGAEMKVFFSCSNISGSYQFYVAGVN